MNFMDFKLPEITPITEYMSGEASFIALKQAVNEIVSLAPEDNDVFIQAFNISVNEIRYVEPHTFLLRGFNNEGHNTSVVCHYSQLLAHVVYRPKKEAVRKIIGFSTGK